jgi:hypothetical protein
MGLHGALFVHLTLVMFFFKKEGESLLASSSFTNEGVSSDFTGTVTIGMYTGAFWDGLKLDRGMGVLLGDCVFDATGKGNCEGLVESSALVGYVLGMIVVSAIGKGTGGTGACVGLSGIVVS